LDWLVGGRLSIPIGLTTLAFTLIVTLASLFGLAHPLLPLGSLPSQHFLAAFRIAAVLLVPTPRRVMILTTQAQTFNLARLSIFRDGQR
jgi:hypothetical protein